LYLDEKHKRLYPGLLATRIGRGGVKAVSEAFRINQNTNLLIKTVEAHDIEIHDMLGRTMLKFRLNEGNNQLDISTLSKGIYTISFSKIGAQTILFTQKIAIQ
jgi:hypothetical protein